MLATVTNNSGAELKLDYPFNVTLAAGAAVTLGLNPEHLTGKTSGGDEAWRYLGQLIKDGAVTVTLALDAANDSDLLSQAAAL